MEHFLSKYAENNDQKPKVIEKELMNILLNYDWPGNVRELEMRSKGYVF